MAEDRDMNGDRWLKLFLGKILPTLCVVGLGALLLMRRDVDANTGTIKVNTRGVEDAKAAAKAVKKELDKHSDHPIHPGASERVTALETRMDSQKEALKRIEQKLDRVLEKK